MMNATNDNVARRAALNSSRVAVLDPGFAHPHAHHLSVNLGVVEAACNCGMDVVLVAARDLDVASRRRCVEAGAVVVSHWVTPGYPANADRLETGEHDRFAASFADELFMLYESGFLRPSDHLHLHTLYSFHLEGLARALFRLRDRVRGRVLISFMFAPAARVPAPGRQPEVLDAREYARYRRALSLIGRLDDIDIRIATSCRSFQRAYGHLWTRSNVLLHPSVVYRPTTSRPRQADGLRRRCLLYLGGPKTNKGLEFSARLGAACAPTMPDVQFVFHYNTEFPGAEQFAPLISNLRAAGVEHDNVEIIEGGLTDVTYDELLASLEAACLLYDPTEYRCKTSGVLWDLLRHPGMRFMVSEHTWLADELRELGIDYVCAGFGDLAQTSAALRSMLASASAGDPSAPPDIRASADYLRLLLRPYGHWLVEALGDGVDAGEGRALAEADVALGPMRAFAQAWRGKLRPGGPQKVLVVRTSYGHFSPLSGPAGFVPQLRRHGIHVDEWAIPLGHGALDVLPGVQSDTLLAALRGRLRSYQGNAVPFETRLQGLLDEYDVVHFVDGEHAGTLTALARLQSPRRRKARLIVTFHQPEAVLDQIVGGGSFLEAFDVVNVLAPSQVSWFRKHVAVERVRVVPHGLASELLEPELPAIYREDGTGLSATDVFSKLADRKIVLCVGSWLRDHESFLSAADLLRDMQECVFVIVGKGVDVVAGERPNVVVFDRGLSDWTLHRLYLSSAVLLLPLRDAAANNAVLESMAHGLPIITTDLPATRFYTADRAIYCSPDPKEYAKAVREFLGGSADNSLARSMSSAFRRIAASLTWERVACAIHDDLYTP